MKNTIYIIEHILRRKQFHSRASWQIFPSIICLALSGFVSLAYAQGVHFGQSFAPQAGLVCQYEKPARDEICLNGTWRFGADTNLGMPEAMPIQFPIWDKTPIKIPSPWNVNSFCMNDREEGGDFCAYPSYPKSWENVSAAWMEKKVTIPENWKGKRIVLHFGAVAGKLVVYFNGHRVGDGFDIFFPQEFDVTGDAQLGAENEILVKVIKPSVFDKPGKYGRREYLSGSFWGTHIAGIWQDVYLLAKPDITISYVFAQPWVDRDELQAEATITNSTSNLEEVEVSGNVFVWQNLAGKSTLEAPEVKWRLADQPALNLPPQRIKLSPGESRTVVLASKVAGRLKLWNPDSPNLYGLLVHVACGGKMVDTKYQRFGWRQFAIHGNRFFLNGKPIVLKGDSWHFMGVPQMTRRYAYAWYRLLKDAGANAVRLHASVYPSFYHDMADEMGIMILDESAIWLSDGGPKADSDLFWRNCRAHVAELVRRDRNHPSVFGWSVCNEVLPVLRNVWHAPNNMIDECQNQISEWKNICRTNDPTRTWISGDGEWDADGRLPVINIHYGGENSMQRAANADKPWAMGETSMAYYGTPKQVSKFNGDQAYASDLGRMKGLAYECCGLLRDQQKYHASYQSVFNIVWYALQPLPLGKRDIHNPIKPDEGIFFGQYREAVPGMQPERLGPYTTTLNPGYDPALPLYRPWPMFDAIREANLKITNSIWAELPAHKKMEPAKTSSVATKTVCYVPGNGELLAQTFSRAGVTMATYSSASGSNIMVVNGSFTAGDQRVQVVKKAVDEVLNHDGTVWIWNINPTGAKILSQWFGRRIEVEPHVASSFVVEQNNPLLAGLGNAHFYFSEDDDWKQMVYGIGGDFTNNAKVVLSACPADWRKWNFQPEPLKTAALFRSEQEDTASRAAIVIGPVEEGRVILCNLDPQVDSLKKAELISQLFRNEGVETAPLAMRSEFIDFGGHLIKALACGGFPFSDDKEAYAQPLPGAKIHPGMIWDRRKWVLLEADKKGVFDFRNKLIEGKADNAFAYIAVWIKSPKPLNDLLSEPNLPKLSFIYGSDDGCQVWLNGELLASHQRTGPLEPGAFAINPLLLKLGWNQLVIRVVQRAGQWQFAGRFDCSDASFLSKLTFAEEEPNSP